MSREGVVRPEQNKFPLSEQAKLDVQFAIREFRSSGGAVDNIKAIILEAFLQNGNEPITIGDFYHNRFLTILIRPFLVLEKVITTKTFRC